MKLIKNKKKQLKKFIDYDEFNKKFQKFNFETGWTKEKRKLHNDLLLYLDSFESITYEASYTSLPVPDMSNLVWTEAYYEVPMNKRGHLKKYRGYTVLILILNRPSSYNRTIGCYPIFPPTRKILEKEISIISNKIDQFRTYKTWTKEKYSIKKSLLFFIQKNYDSDNYNSNRILKNSKERFYTWNYELKIISNNQRGYLKKYRGCKIFFICTYIHKYGSRDFLLLPIK